MSKVLKTVGKIVTIAAFAAGVLATGGLLAAGAPFLTALSVGFGATIGGLGLSATTLLLVGAGVSAIGAATAGAPNLEDTGANLRGTPFVDAGSPGAYVFGETAAPLAVVFEENYGVNKEFVANVIAHAWHRIDSFQTLHVDAELVSFSGNAATGPFAGIITWLRNTGTATQAALALPGTLWPATAKGVGMAHSALIWNFKNQTKLSGGVPNNIVVKIRGAMMYDPRLDSTAGGSGAHRYADPTTWTYNAGNAALVALRYMIGERAGNGRLIWGVGEAQTDVDIASFIAAANIADEVRDGVARYNLAGFFPTTNNHEAFFSQWEANTGGRITRIGGRRYVWLPANDLIPLTTIDDGDILSGAVVTLRAATPIEALVNTARGRYISPADLYQGAIYPDVIETSALAEDGTSRVLDLDFSWVQVLSQAERTARQSVRRSRFGRLWTLAVGWEGILYPVFSVLALSIKETDYVTTLARVIDKSMSASGVTVLTLQEEDAAIYDDTIPLGSPVVNSIVVNRLSRFGTTTPRYIDNTLIDALRPTDIGATRGSPGVGPPRIRIGGGATGIKLVANQLSDGTPNDGEIRVKKGFWRLQDGSVRTLLADTAVFTPFDGALYPPDGVFYIVWGLTDPAVRFPTMPSPFGNSIGLFTATYDRITDQWRAHSNLPSEIAVFNPLASDVVFAMGLIAPPATSITNILQLVAISEGFTGPNLIESAVQKLDTGGSVSRTVPVGLAQSVAFDGDVIAFSQNWGSAPGIMFGAGGRLTDPALDNTQQAAFQAINLTSAGFTASLKLIEAPSAPVPVTDAPAAPGGPGFFINKSAAGESFSDIYVFNYHASAGATPVGEPASAVIVGFYTRASLASPWILRGSALHQNSASTAFSQQIIVDGLGVNSGFAMSTEDSGPNAAGTLKSFDSVNYSTGTPGFATATPAGASPIRYQLFGSAASV